MYNTGYIPERMREFTFITVPKKEECEKHRAASITSQLGKIVLVVIRNRIRHIDCLLGRTEGTRSRGRQRIKYTDALVAKPGGGWTVVDLVRLADSRRDWRFVVVGVT